MTKGWVRLHRQLEDWPLYFSEKFTKTQAWIDLFLMANHTKQTISIRGNILEIERGQIAWSELTMMKRWKWSKVKVKNFLKWLETGQQIAQQNNRYMTTIITILNYEKFQKDTADSPAERQQTVHKQECKELKNDKKYNNITEQDKKLFESYEDLCIKKSIENQIGVTKYLEMRGEYEIKVNWWVQVQACLNWMSDNKKEILNASRLRNWVEKSIRFAKDKQMKDQQHFQDKQNQLKPKIKTLLPPLWTPPV